MEAQIFSEIKSLGCKKDKEAAAAVQVYLDLCEVKKYWDVNYFYNSASETVYLTAKQSKSSNTCVYVPVSSSQELSFDTIQKYLHLSEECDGRIILVFVESDSTSVYYQFSDGLADAGTSCLRAEIERKRNKLDSDIKKLSPIIQHSALCGLSLPKAQKETPE